jgi:hypothetical protein
MNHSPKKIGYLTLDLDIQPDFIEITHKKRASMPLQMKKATHTKKAGHMTGFFAEVIGATYENMSLVIPLYQPIDSS